VTKRACEECRYWVSNAEVLPYCGAPGDGYDEEECPFEPITKQRAISKKNLQPPTQPMAPVLAKVEKSPTGIFRTVFELSPMCNNDEWVIHSETPVDRQKDSRMVMCRPVYQIEIDDGLKVELGLRQRLGSEPEITTLIDAFWRVRDGVVSAMSWGDLAHAIAHHVAYTYYDCMSEGMPLFQPVVIRMICEQCNVPLDTPVYPKMDNPEDDTWYTLADFLGDFPPDDTYKALASRCSVLQLPLLKDN